MSRIRIIVGMLLIPLLSSILLSTNVSANDTSITTTIKVSESCSITSTLDTPHIAYLPAGIYSGNYNSDGHDYRNGIGKTTIKAFCNDSAGFSIYAIGYTNDTFGNNTLIGPDNNTIVTGTGTSGETSNWAMKIGTVAGTYAPTLENGYGSFKAVPSTYDKVASFNSTTDLTNGSSITTTYAAYIASTQAPGTYNGKVKYTLVHPVDETPLQPQVTESGKICYYPNATRYEGTMGCQTLATSATSVMLLASNYSRDGYGFAGWSTTFDYSDPNGFLGPQEYIEFEEGTYSGDNNGLSLYAHWVKSQGDLQNWSGCSSLQSGTVTALTDQRDNDTYAVAKLADGNCWMIENLRLDNTAEHNSDGALAQGYGTSATYGNFSGLANAENTNFTNSTAANSLYYSGTQSGDATIDIGASDYPDYRIPRYSNLNTPENASNRPQEPTNNTFQNSNTVVGMYSYGNYYTWHAAIADTTYYNGGEHGATSLCPTGWRLPIGDQSTANMSFGKLSVSLGGPEGGAMANGSSTPTGAEMSRIFRSYPNNFIYSGYFHESLVYYRGGNGNYWSSTAGSYNGSYGLLVYSTLAYPGTYNYEKYYGFAIRCLISGV